MGSPQHPLAPLIGAPDSDTVLEAFLEAMETRGLELYPEQEEAILELFGGKHVVLKTPTGSGKSLVAGALLFLALCRGQRAVYTCPIKALVNEKFLSLCREHGPENVGLMTGDATVNPRAPILCCTAEILSNIALCGGGRARIEAVVMDEFHYYGDADRGAAWQIPLLLMPDTQFLLMSATLGNMAELEEDLHKRSEREVSVVEGDTRPVPLEFTWSEDTLIQRVEGLALENKLPAYLVYFSQRAATEAAQGFIAVNLCTREEREHLGEILSKHSFKSPFGKDLKRWLRHGIGVHHAGLLPRYRILVESLAQQGLLKVICGTDTLGVGINVPIRTVVFTQLWKYDGRKSAILSVRDFRQIAGRAGRRGYDDCGYVIAQAPEHVIENKKAEEKAAAKGGKKKVSKKSAPEGVPGWDEQTFAKLQTAPHETLAPVFDINHGMLLLVLSRDEDGCRVLQRLIRESHVTEFRKRELRKRAWVLFRALKDRDIVTLIDRQPSGRKLEVNIELQEDFSLHQTLSLYLIDTLEQLDPEDSEYVLQVLSLCEAIVEDPDVILYRQIDKLKEVKIREMKEAGIEYEERMERLQEIEHPKPMREFLYDSFNEFKRAHPWVEEENVQPKSIAREMFEEYLGFGEYVNRYKLHRSEGVLLRHLSQVYKVLTQTVPEAKKTEDVWDAEDFLFDMIRGTDSSLLDEWELLRNPEYRVKDLSDKPERPQTYDLTRDKAAFERAIRTDIFRVLKLVSSGTAEEGLAARFTEFHEARGRFLLDPEARNAKHTYVDSDAEPGAWHVAQVLVDPEGLNDWEARFRVDLVASREAQAPVMELREAVPVVG
jgi:superfamily II RNA helicase